MDAPLPMIAFLVMLLPVGIRVWTVAAGVGSEGRAPGSGPPGRVTNLGLASAVQVGPDDVLKALRSFPKGSAPGCPP